MSNDVIREEKLSEGGIGKDRLSTDGASAGGMIKDRICKDKMPSG